MIPYNINFNKLRETIRSLGFTKIVLQLPEGMQIYAFEIAKELDDYEVYISANPCYGACDIETYKGFLTIQFGHSKIPNIKYPKNVIFVEALSKISFKKVVKKFMNLVECKRIGVLASIQHIKAIDSVKKFLEEGGFDVFVGKGDSRITYPGQVLGCNFSAARDIKNVVDCFVFLGTGVFHGLGAKIVTEKSVYVLDPYTNKVTEIKEENFLKQRYGAIAKAKNANKFGIIVSSKIGQKRWKLAKMVKNSIEEKGKDAFLIVVDNIVPENLYYDVDAYINTACPRITYDDFSRFKKVVLSPIEALIAIEVKNWNNFAFDEIVEVD